MEVIQEITKPFETFAYDDEGSVKRHHKICIYNTKITINKALHWYSDEEYGSSLINLLALIPDVEDMLTKKLYVEMQGRTLKLDYEPGVIDVINYHSLHELVHDYYLMADRFLRLTLKHIGYDDDEDKADQPTDFSSEQDIHDFVHVLFMQIRDEFQNTRLVLDGDADNYTDSKEQTTKFGPVDPSINFSMGWINPDPKAPIFLQYCSGFKLVCLRPGRRGDKHYRNFVFQLRHSKISWERMTLQGESTISFDPDDYETEQELFSALVKASQEVLVDSAKYLNALISRAYKEDEGSRSHRPPPPLRPVKAKDLRGIIRLLHARLLELESRDIHE